jgi:hypothetical protein
LVWGSGAQNPANIAIAGAHQPKFANYEAA